MNAARPRVLFVDNNPQEAQSWGDRLRRKGYNVMVAKGIGSSLEQNAVELGRSFRPHVAIVDLRISGSPELDGLRMSDRSGLELLRALKSAHCILRSNFLTPEVTFAAVRDYGVIHALEKGDAPQRLLAVVADAASKKSSVARSWPADWRPSSWDSGRVVNALLDSKTHPSPGMADDVLYQLFPGSKELILEEVSGAVVTPQSVSSQRSMVLKATQDGFQPVVVKLAVAPKIQQEVGNYNQHVKDRLGGLFYARMDRTVSFWDLGGVVYSFLGTPTSVLPPFKDYYQSQSDLGAIFRPLGHFFREVWSELYARSSPCDSDTSLFGLYDEAFDLSSHLEILRDQGSFSPVERLDIAPSELVSWILKHRDRSLIRTARLAVTHGDLHGNNLFVDGEHAWAIDFERTGPSHSLRDFVELELDIATRLAKWDERDHMEFYRFALRIAAPIDPTHRFDLVNPDDGSESSKALRTIWRLRALAFEMTHYRDQRELIWGLLLNSLYVASLLEDKSPQRIRVLILARVLTERLRRGNAQWPPEGWAATD